MYYETEGSFCWYQDLAFASGPSSDIIHRQQDLTHLLSWQLPYIAIVHFIKLPPLPVSGYVTVNIKSRLFLTFTPSSPSLPSLSSFFFSAPLCLLCLSINLSHVELHWLGVVCSDASPDTITTVFNLPNICKITNH